MIAFLLFLYFMGMLTVIALAVVQRALIQHGYAKIVNVKDVDLDSGAIRLRSYKRVENGIWTFDWLPSDFLRMSFMSWLFWIIILIVVVHTWVNKQINKIDEN